MMSVRAGVAFAVTVLGCLLARGANAAFLIECSVLAKNSAVDPIVSFGKCV